MFKNCKMCKAKWETLEDFLRDSDVPYHGYQACFTAPQNGLFLFNHTTARCKSTLSVRVDAVLPELDTTDKFAMGQSPHCTGLCHEVSSVEECKETNCVGNQIRQQIKKLKYKLAG